MIQEITFKNEYFCFDKGFNFKPKQLNLLVGDQGAGKSMFISACTNHADETLKVNADKGTEFISFNSEKDPLRKKDPNPNSSYEIQRSIQERFISHGEALLPYLLGLEEVEGIKVIFLDEPEASLSLRSQYEVVELIKKLLDKGDQLIIATHSTLLMEAFPDNIYSMEHRRWMKYKNFLKSQKSPDKHIIKRTENKIKKDNCSLGFKCTCVEESGRYKRSCEHSAYAVSTRGSRGRRRK
jgi:predicted ATPase